jgi:hypothetical protein
VIITLYFFVRGSRNDGRPIREKDLSMLTQEGQFDFDKSSEAAESRVLFGPPALLPGESLAEYWRLYSLFQADLQPDSKSRCRT